MSQNDQILAHLERKPITDMQALRLYGVRRLASRIRDLKNDGNFICTEMIAVKKNTRIARYHLVGAV